MRETTRNGEELCPKCGTPMIVRTDDNPEAFAKRRKDYVTLKMLYFKKRSRSHPRDLLRVVFYIFLRRGDG